MTEMTKNMSLMAKVKSEATFPEIPNDNVLIKSELLENYYENGDQQQHSFTDQNNNGYSQQRTSMTSTTSNGNVSK